MGLDHKALPIAQCQPILSKMFADFPLSEHAMTTVWEQLVSLQPPKKKIKADKDGACAQLVPYMSCTNAELVSKLSLRDNRVASLRASNKQHLDNLLKSRIKCEELQHQLATITQERDSAFAELSFKGDHKKSNYAWRLPFGIKTQYRLSISNHGAKDRRWLGANCV